MTDMTDREKMTDEELSVAVAEKVMGWTPIYRAEWSPERDWNDAMKVVERMVSDPKRFGAFIEECGADCPDDTGRSDFAEDILGWLFAGNMTPRWLSEKALIAMTHPALAALEAVKE